MTKTNYITDAVKLINAGISVGPLRTDGQKTPAIKWKKYQSCFMTQEEVEKHFENCGGIFAITGSISNLFLFDFDLKYDHVDEDTYEKFIEKVPPHLLAKFSINETRSGGKHIWVRTQYTDRSRKITRRELTLYEFVQKVQNAVNMGANEKTAMRIALTAPYECTLETRGEGSYGVMVHPSYKSLAKSNGQWVTKDEMEFLICLGYSLDWGFKKRDSIFSGDEDVYKEISQFNEDCGPEGMIQMIEKSGLYFTIGEDYNGNHLMRRVGSDSNHSGYVYGDTGIFKVFGTNLFDTHKDTLSPFDVYRFINGYTLGEAVEKIIEKRKERV